MTSLPDAVPWTHRGKMAAGGTRLFPPPTQDLRMRSSSSIPFPFPVYSLSPAAVCHRRAWNFTALQKASKELLSTAAATASLVNHPFLGRLPWQPPLCCLLQPEVAARRSRAGLQFPLVGDALPSQPPQRVASRRRDSPVNWLLSDDVRATSSANRKWNSPADRRPAASGQRDEERRPPSRARLPADGSGTGCSGGGGGGGGVVVASRKLTCRHCGKPYASLGALKMHIRTHTLPCRCQLCGKAFSRPWLLQGHTRTHTGERPFACPQCGRAFADRSNLRAHLQTHAELKKYACDRCTKTFSRLSLLVKHRNGPAVCRTAAAAASSSSSWRP